MAQDPGMTAAGLNNSGVPTPPTIQLLPIDKVFPIQIGSEVFRISYVSVGFTDDSGNALNSDSPSYFTQFFATNIGDTLKPLYIDRDPAIFKDIVRHLQGYLVTPRNEEHFVYLYSDAIYYRLPRLRARLFRDFYVRVGDTSFQIPRELFNDVKQKGDSKNFFSMGFGSAMGSPFPHDKMFPQLNMDNFDAEKQLRPPYIVPPKLSRSSDNFNEILKYMQGYELEIRNNIHRRNLIKDSKFYNLRHLSEVLIPAKLYHNPFRGSTEELHISITDFRAKNARVGWVEGKQFGFMEYKRPHDIDDTHKDLLIQIDDDGLIVGGGKIMLINRQALNSIKTLKETAEGRKTETHSGHLPGGQHEIAIRIEIPNECYVMVDGQEGTGLLDSMPPISSTPAAPPQNGGESPVAKKRKVGEAGDGVVTPATTAAPEPKVVTLKRSIWRVKVKGQNLPPSTEGGPQSTSALLAGRRAMVLLAVKIEGWTREKEFSKEIDWL